MFYYYLLRCEYLLGNDQYNCMHWFLVDYTEKSVSGKKMGEGQKNVHIN